VSKSEELVRFHNWAEKRDLMYTVHWGCQGFWEDVEINSAAESECYYEKKVGCLDDYVMRWEERFKALTHPAG
jgi:hypothetical protein